MAASSFPVLAGTALVDDGTKTAGALPVYDANGNVPIGALKTANSVITATGTSAGSLSAGVGLYFFAGTAAATYTLPSETNSVGVHMSVINGTTNVLTIAPFGAETINASTNTTTVATNTTGSAATAGKVFRTDPSTNTGFLAT